MWIFALFASLSWSKLNFMKKITLISLALFSLSASAEIYEAVGENGERLYSDRVTKGSKPVKIEGTSSYKPPKYRRSTPSSQEEVEPFSYKSVVITQPLNDATLFDSDGAITVLIKPTPALRNGDRVQLLIDGVAAGEPLHATDFSLGLEARGAHKLVAEVQTSKGKVVGRSEPVLFYYRKHSVLFRK
jgi:hypothetical protein